jgi:hypothetical protein
LGIDVEIISDIEFDKPSPAPAHSPEYAQSSNPSDVWRRVGNWTIAVDHTIDDGCFAMSSFDNDSVFRIGIDPVRSKSYYFILGNTNWTSLKVGEEYELDFQFDQESPWNGTARVVKIGNGIFLMVSFSDESFWNEFIGAQALSVTRGNVSVTQLRLDGSKVAFDALIECQTAQNNRKQARDPFTK